MAYCKSSQATVWQGYKQNGGTRIYGARQNQQPPDYTEEIFMSARTDKINKAKGIVVAAHITWDNVDSASKPTYERINSYYASNSNVDENDRALDQMDMLNNLRDYE